LDDAQNFMTAGNLTRNTWPGCVRLPQNFVMKRNQLITAALTGGTALAQDTRPRGGINDCRSHLFFPEVLDILK
jgi:hypothetical protein